MYVLGGNADGLGGHLGEHGVAPLADLGGPQVELHRAVLVEHHTGGGRLQGDGVHAGLVGEAGHAHAPAHRAALILVLLPQLRPADEVRALLDALGQAGGVAGDAVEGVYIAQGHEVCQPEGLGIPALFPGNVVHHALYGEVTLGNAVAPHGAGGGPVGVDGVGRGVVADPVQIELPEARDGIGHDGVAVGGVAPLVGDGGAGAGHQAHVAVHRRRRVKGDGVAGAGVLEGLLPGDVQPDTAAPHLGGKPGVEGLVEHLLLVAEAAADVGLDHPDGAPADAHGLADHPADDVGDLGGGDHHDAPPLHPGVGDGVLDVAVLYLLGVVAPPELVIGGAGQHVLHAVEVRLRHGRAEIHPGQDVVRVLLVEHRRALRHGLLRLQHHGVLLILHPDELQGPPGGDLVLRHHGGNVVAVDAHTAVEQLAVGHVLVGLLHAPGVAGGGVLDVRHVKAGQHLHHPGQGLGGGDIHGLDPAVGNGAVENLRLQHRTGAEIVGVFGAAGHLVGGVHAGDAPPDFHKTHLLLFMPPVYRTGQEKESPIFPRAAFH